MEIVKNPMRAIVFASPLAEMTISDADGVVVVSFPIPAGKHNVSDFAQMLSDGEYLSFSASRVIDPPFRTGVLGRKTPFRSGANNEYHPTSADADRRRLERALTRVEATEKRLQRRETAVRKLAEQHLAKPEFASKRVDPVAAPLVAAAAPVAAPLAAAAAPVAAPETV